MLDMWSATMNMTVTIITMDTVDIRPVPADIMAIEDLGAMAAGMVATAGTVNGPTIWQ
jgi:hypothetical protein